AGVAGVIKMIEAIRHQTLPKTLHVDTPSTHVDWTSGAVELLTQERPWPRNGHLLRAGISSFGVSGTNAHVILEQAPAVVESPESASATESMPATDLPAAKAGGLVWVLSGRSGEGLLAQGRRLQEWLLTRPELDPVDVGWSLIS
ncbi:ketoacyl-synthetase C-terminal extension domain-containing protein, partial [Nocardia noduli]|uniref:ketoacyl-synthetase C-terminal extension domain-containing protein n=1 Tax=Nocardia noduli TaxID=2815722 RepID=UPI0027E15051